MGGKRRRSRRGEQRGDFSPTGAERDLLRRAPFITDEEDTRDIWVTDLLGIYVDAYEEKVERNRGYRENILWLCITVIVLFAIMLALLPFQVLENGSGLEMSDAIAFATACVSFLALIVGLLHVITEYVFPKDDEQYITEIVKAIQNNDLENRKVTARYGSSASAGFDGGDPGVPSGMEELSGDPLQGGDGGPG